MSTMIDRNNILDNYIKDVNQEDLSSLIDNYFENILHSDQKVVHSDFISQIIWFNKNYDYSQIIIKHIDNFLKQKKIGIRNTIKRGAFTIDELLKIINNYGMKINSFSSLCLNNSTNVLKISSLQLFETIISDPQTINFLKNKFNNILEENNMVVRNLFDIMCSITNLNPELNVDKWFILLIATSIQNYSEEIFNKTYPVNENHQFLINIVNLFDYFDKIMNYFHFMKGDSAFLLADSILILNDNISKLFTCESSEILEIISNNIKILNKITNLPYIDDNKKNYNLLKDTIIFNFLKLINDNFDNNKEFNFDTFKDIINILSHLEYILGNTQNKELVYKKISQLLSSDILIDNLNDLDNFSSIVKFGNYIKEKDRFMDIYNKKLIQRILNNPNLEVEDKNCKILTDKFGFKLTFKTNKIISNVMNSVKELANFKKINIPELKYKSLLELVITSYNTWDFNQNEGLINTDKVNINSDVFSLIKVYNKFYKEIYSNERKINWYLHFGEINFIVNNDSGKKVEYKMMPIQYILMEYIYKNPMKSKDEIIKLDILENYSDNFKQSLIGSLVLGGIIKIDNDKFIFNDGNTSDIIDYIQLFFSTTNYEDIWEKKRYEELILDREDILSSNINHYVKVKPINKEDLFKIILDNLTVFPCDKELYEKVLEIMVKKDYISIKDNLVEKLFY